MRLTSAEVVIGILAAVFLFCARAERRRFEHEAARDAGQHARRDYDKLDALIQATRDWPHESYAWGPPARERLVTPFRHDCGCRLGSDLRGQPYWRPCEAHEREDGDFALWQAELEDQR